MARIYDHLTASHEDDEVMTALCGLSEDDLPEAPMCPRCARLQKQTRRPVRRLIGAVFLPHKEPTAHR